MSADGSLHDANPYEGPQAPADALPGAVEATAKNGLALVAYYLAAFSMIPVLGFPFSLAAVCFGLLGLAQHFRRPTKRGAVYAWIGILLGMATALAWGMVLFWYLSTATVVPAAP